MRLIMINIVMAIASLLIMGFAYWTYNQSVYDSKVKEHFQSKAATSLTNLKTISSLADRLVVVKGEILADETFVGKSGKKVVLERFLEELKDKDSKKDWKVIKESKSFKALPFWLKEKSNKVLIDAYDLDKTFLGTPQIKTETLNGQLKRTSIWTLSPGQPVFVLGNIDNKAGQLTINSPNLYKSDFNPFVVKEPFIITTLSVFEVSNKADELSQSVYYTSLALFAIGAFFIFTSIKNIMQAVNKLKTENDSLY